MPAGWCSWYHFYHLALVAGDGNRQVFRYHAIALAQMDYVHYLINC